MNSTRLFDIEELAESISESYFPEGKVDPLVILESKGITYSLGAYDQAFDGLLEYRNKKFHIYVNSNMFPSIHDARCRFTFCHELGHYFIDDHRKALMGKVGFHPSQVDYQSDNDAEREADAFAASMLMPKSKLDKALSRTNISKTAILSIAKTFGTSLTSTAIRITKVSEDPIIVMKWGNTERNWCWVSEAAKRNIRGFGVKSTSHLPSGSLSQVLASDVSTSLEREKQATTLSSWFPGIRKGSSQDRVYIEEVCHLGRFGFLTILTEDQGT